MNQFPDSAFIFSQELIDFGQLNDYPKGIAQGYNLQGISLKINGDYYKAQQYLDKSMVIYQQIKDKRGQATCLNNLGLVHQALGDPAHALTSYLKSEELLEELGENRIRCLVLTNIAAIYLNHGYKREGFESLITNLEIQKELGDQRGMASTLHSIGNYYFINEQFSEALKTYNEALSLRDSGDMYGKGLALNNIGLIYQGQRNYETALEHHYHALSIQQEMNDRSGEATSKINIGKAHLQLGNTLQAITYCQEGYELAHQLKDLLNQKYGCRCLYNAFKKIGKMDKAMVYLEKIQDINDSLSRKDVERNFQNVKFSKEIYADSVERAQEMRLQKEKHKAEIRRKNLNRNGALVFGFFVLLIASGFYRRWQLVQRSNIAINKEKERSEKLLLNILPKEIATELKEKGYADAREYKQASILFTDFHSFTSLSDRMGMEEMVNELNHCFKAFDAICMEYGLEKIKTIGDSYMAAGGVPLPNERVAQDTVMAALSMVDFIEKRKSEREAAGKIPFEMRTGIHVGNVIGGIIGENKFQFDLWGDTVNTASRMESTGEVGKVNISKATYDLIKDDPKFVFEHRGRLEAKGKGELEMYFVGLREFLS